MSISTPVWTSTSFFPPPNSSRLWPPVRKKGTLSGNPIKGVHEFSAKPERSRTELHAVSYREADVRGRESPDSGIPYIGTYLYYICVVHISGQERIIFPRTFLPTRYHSVSIHRTYTGGISRTCIYIISREISNGRRLERRYYAVECPIARLECAPDYRSRQYHLYEIPIVTIFYDLQLTI